MDTTEQYIKMCDCPEIQNQQDEELCGEVFAYKNTASLRENGWETAMTCLDIIFPYPLDCIWLPRQDQLQGMIPKSWSLSYLPQDKKYTFHLYGPQTFTGQTPEQALIQGVMYELYIKRWIGEKWEKEA